MRVKRKVKSNLAVALAASILAGGVVSGDQAEAATKLSVSAKTISLQVGKSATLKTNQKVSWTSSDKKVAVVKKVSSKKAKIVAVKSGTCNVTVKNGKSKATVKVTVKKKQSAGTQAATPVIGVQTPEPVDTSIYTGNAAGVTVTLVSNTAGSVRFSLKNDNSSIVTYGKEYRLERLEHDTWSSVSYVVENPTVPAVLCGLENNSISNCDINLKEFYGELSKGTYRVIKAFYVNGNSYNIACEFEVSE